MQNKGGGYEVLLWQSAAARRPEWNVCHIPEPLSVLDEHNVKERL